MGLSECLEKLVLLHERSISLYFLKWVAAVIITYSSVERIFFSSLLSPGIVILCDVSFLKAEAISKFETFNANLSIGAPTELVFIISFGSFFAGSKSSKPSIVNLC